MEFDAFFLARLQFAFTVSFSYYFPRDYDWLSQLPGGTGGFMAKNA